MKLAMLVAATVMATQTTCCDPDHYIYDQNAQSAGTCRDRGGVPVVEVQTDVGGHRFIVLKTCVFPPCTGPLEKELTR